MQSNYERYALYTKEFLLGALAGVAIAAVWLTPVFLGGTNE